MFASSFVFAQFTIDDTYIYLDGKILEWADPKSWKKIESNNYGRPDYYIDINYVYTSAWERLDGVDPKTWEILDSWLPPTYSKDKNWIYYHFWNLNSPVWFVRLEWAGLDNIKFLNNNKYAISNWSIYYEWTDVWLSNVSNVQELEWNYLIVNNDIIFKWKYINSANWFEVLDLDDELKKAINKKNANVVEKSVMSTPTLTRPIWLIEWSRWYKIKFYKNSIWDIFLWGEIVKAFWDEKKIRDSITHGWIDTWIITMSFGNFDRTNWLDPKYEFSQIIITRLDTLIQAKLVPNISKNNLEKTLESLISRTEWYRYGSLNEAIQWTFYRHIYSNLDMYYANK